MKLKKRSFHLTRYTLYTLSFSIFDQFYSAPPHIPQPINLCTHHDNNDPFPLHPQNAVYNYDKNTSKIIYTLNIDSEVYDLTGILEHTGSSLKNGHFNYYCLAAPYGETIVLIIFWVLLSESMILHICIYFR